MKPEAVSNNSARILSNWSRPCVGWLDSMKPKGTAEFTSSYTLFLHGPQKVHTTEIDESLEKEIFTAQA